MDAAARARYSDELRLFSCVLFAVNVLVLYTGAAVFLRVTRRRRRSVREFAQVALVVTVRVVWSALAWHAADADEWGAWLACDCVSLVSLVAAWVHVVDWPLHTHDVVRAHVLASLTVALLVANEVDEWSAAYAHAEHAFVLASLLMPVLVSTTLFFVPRDIHPASRNLHMALRADDLERRVAQCTRRAAHAPCRR